MKLKYIVNVDLSTSKSIISALIIKFKNIFAKTRSKKLNNSIFQKQGGVAFSYINILNKSYFQNSSNKNSSNSSIRLHELLWELQHPLFDTKQHIKMLRERAVVSILA